MRKNNELSHGFSVQHSGGFSSVKAPEISLVFTTFIQHIREEHPQNIRFALARTFVIRHDRCNSEMLTPLVEA